MAITAICHPPSNNPALLCNNPAHYNLPAEQQAAIERFLNVHSWPTYKLFNCDGDLLDLNVDARRLEELARLLDKLK